MSESLCWGSPGLGVFLGESPRGRGFLWESSREGLYGECPWNLGLWGHLRGV